MLSGLFRTLGSQGGVASFVASWGAFFSTAHAKPASPPSQLTLEIHGVTTVQGQLCIALFRSEHGFPSENHHALLSHCVPLSTGISPERTTQASFENLAPGQYAAAVFHDANGDGKLNTGLFGIPKEDFGFTANPKVRLGAPSFRDSALTLEGGQTLTARITLQSFQRPGSKARASSAR